eukprot:sb/3475438/
MGITTQFDYTTRILTAANSLLGEVTSVACSPLDLGQLVSSSDDYTVRHIQSQITAKRLKIELKMAIAIKPKNGLRDADHFSILSFVSTPFLTGYSHIAENGYCPQFCLYSFPSLKTVMRKPNYPII